MAVRHGDGSDSHQMRSELIPCYVHLGIERAAATSCSTCKRRAYLRVYDTLIETMCDSELSKPWRESCYSYLRKMLPLLYEILGDKSYARKLQQCTTFYQYFVTASSTESVRPYKSITKT